MPDLNVRVAEGCTPDVTLLWDTVWDPAVGVGDWAVAAPGTVGNAGGLQATAALETAVILALFTDRACPPDHPLARFADGDLRGWWGDGVDVRTDLGETPLGSLLWLLERSALDDVETARWAVAFAQDALAPLVAQKAVVRVDVQAAARKTANRLDLAVQLYGRDGSLAYARRFDDVWAQLRQGA